MRNKTLLSLALFAFLACISFCQEINRISINSPEQLVGGMLVLDKGKYNATNFNDDTGIKHSIYSKQY